MTVIISQADYKIFSSKVKKLASKGINLDFQVTKPNHKKVKVTMNQEYNWAELDRVCDG
tara:strand:+ start:516 stop:692 length:177 start_codon:yes stop_codon:yes gene_type:complete